MENNRQNQFLEAHYPKSDGLPPSLLDKMVADGNIYPLYFNKILRAVYPDRPLPWYTDTQSLLFHTGTLLHQVVPVQVLSHTAEGDYIAIGDLHGSTARKIYGGVPNGYLETAETLRACLRSRK